MERNTSKEGVGMKKIYIIGAGLSAGSITAEAASALRKSAVVFGAERLLEDYAPFIKEKTLVPEYASDKVIKAIKESSQECFSVLVSGDPGFYSAALKLCEGFDQENGEAEMGSDFEHWDVKYEVKVLPGISSVNAMFAALKRPWQDAVLCSFHGRDVNAAELVRRNREVFFLTGKNTAELSKKLCDAGYGGLALRVGQDLGRPTERVFSCMASELAGMELSSLTVVLAENPMADDSVRFGLADEEFVRGNVPMTKSEVRAVVMSKLGIRPGMVCADIGAGTGSCTVEMALAAWKGKVYAIDPNPEAVELIKLNCRNFHIGNVEAVEGLAPDDMKDWPALDAVFVGGSKGNMAEIFDAVLEKNPKARIVTSAIVLQTLQAAMDAFARHGIDPEIVQISAAASKKVGGMDMMMARNPIFIISGGGEY